MTQGSAALTPRTSGSDQPGPIAAPGARAGGGAMSGLGLMVQLGLAALLVVAVVLAAWLLNAGALRSIDQARVLEKDARAQTRAVTATIGALADAETGQRGFLLTSEDAYLAPYADSGARVTRALDALEQMAAGSAWMRDDVAALRQAAARKMAELGDTLAIARARGAPAAVAIVRTGVGRIEMEAARAAADRLLAGSELERQRAAALVRQREQRATRDIALAAVAGALLLGAAVVLLLLGRDRARRARAAERLQMARLAGAVEHMRDGMAVFDAAGRLLLANDHLRINTGWPARLLLPGATIADLAAASAEWPNAPLASLRPNSPARGVETQVDGRILELWHSPMPDGGQMLTIADITRRTQAETVARQAQRMEALGQLTGGVAHDFNNLLQVVSANLELLGSRLTGEHRGADDWLQARLSAALSGVERAARLTRHLLAFARRQPLAPQSVDTRALLSGLEDLLRRTLGERVAVEMVLSGGLWPLCADPQQLENALLNLAINARDAMPEGGKLTIEASNASLDDQYAANHAEVAPGQYVLIAVTDTGCGMSADQLVRALEPFYTTKPDGRGTGLGLPMVFGFAKQSEGHFKLYSEPGHGTTARLYIPRSRAAPRSFVEKLEPAEPGRGELVLVVEDDHGVRAASVQAVRDLGYRAIEAASAAAALALIKGGMRPDVLFTDVVMPGPLAARDLASQARALLPELGVVFTSGYTENSIVHNGQLDPGVILVSKPWRAAELSRKLQQALREGRNPPAIVRKLRVLLVEDEMLVRMTTADLLADLGHEVIEVGTAAAALAELDNGPPDLLLTDLGLPDMDGMALAAQACRLAPGLRVIIASGREVGPGSGFTVLDKPYDQAGMRRALQAALEGSAPG